MLSSPRRTTVFDDHDLFPNGATSLDTSCLSERCQDAFAKTYRKGSWHLLPFSGTFCLFPKRFLRITSLGSDSGFGIAKKKGSGVHRDTPLSFA